LVIELQYKPVDSSMLPDIADLCGQLGYPISYDQLASQVQNILSHTDHFLWAAQVDGVAHGWVHAQVIDGLTSPRCVEVAGLIVDETYRKHGIGRALMTLVETWAADQGISSIYLRSNIIRKEAHRFYESIGYESIKQQLTFRKNLPSRSG